MPNTRIKICNVSMHYCPITGGQEVYIDNLINTLKNEGVDSSVLQRDTGCKKDNVFFVPYIPKNLFLHKFIDHYAWFVFNIGLFFSRKFLKKQDILICHYPFHYPPLRWHKKVIIVSHGVLWKIPPQSFFDRYHRKASIGAKDRKAFIIANDTHFLREIGFDIQPGEGFFKEVFENVWLIPNCVDVGYFVRKENIKKEKVILVPRNIRYDRGIHLAIEAFNIFIKKYPDFSLEIAGGNESEYFEYCKKLATDYRLADKVKFIGHIDHHELISHYNRAMICLIPSIEKEGTSLSALESMACGTATVVTNVAGLQDLPAVKTPPTPQKIAENLKIVMDNLEKISTEQQKEVCARFNIDIWNTTWMNVIKTVREKK